MTDRSLLEVIADRIPVGWVVGLQAALDGKAEASALASGLAGKADATVVDEVLITADATLDDATAPAGRLVRVHEASEGRVTLTLEDDRPTGWRRTLLVTAGEAALALGNNTLTVDGAAIGGGDTAILTAGTRATLVATATGQLIRV